MEDNSKKDIGKEDENKGEGHFERTQEAIAQTTSPEKSQYSDGYHTFSELYEFRKLYNAALFNEWASKKSVNPKWAGTEGEPVMVPKHDVHKSMRHHDGGLCFGGGWFIVVAMLPTGQVSNHYPVEDWELFRIPSVEKAKYAFDGHTAKDVIERLASLRPW